jgi:hypothetical protein
MKPKLSSHQVLAYFGTAVLAVGFVGLLSSLSAGVEKSGAPQIEMRPVASLTDSEIRSVSLLTEKLAIADTAPAPAITEAVPAPTIDNTAAAKHQDVFVPPAMAADTAEKVEIPADQKPFVVASLPDPSQSLPVETGIASRPDAVPQAVRTVVAPLAGPEDCLLADACIDQYLWALYQRTPKEDTNRVLERRKVTVKRKGKTVTVTRRFVRLVDADFTWKDPDAAERAGMPMMKYVIGGMDRTFKRRLLYMLLAAEQAGLHPGITSAFRDDYRQSIASGQKAAANRSYHGGSLRGGYGHGLAADVVSVRGVGRAQRWLHSAKLWQWIDINGKEFGIGRPYLDRDAPHVAPIDGREYATHYRASNVQLARSGVRMQPDGGNGVELALSAQANGASKIVATVESQSRRDQ